MHSCRVGQFRESWRDDWKRTTSVKAGAFSKAEDDALLAAVREYAEEHHLPQDDLSWAMHMSKVKKETSQRYKTSILSEVCALN